MERLKFIAKRLLYLVIMLWGVATIVFILTKLIPGDPTVANLSQRALNDPEIVAAYKAKYGLDEPLIVQYFMYLGNLLHLDLGTSIRTNNPVLSELARCYPGGDIRNFIWRDFCDPKKQCGRSGCAGCLSDRSEYSQLLVCAPGTFCFLL